MKNILVLAQVLFDRNKDEKSVFRGPEIKM